MQSLETLEHILRKENASEGARGAVRRLPQLLRPSDTAHTSWSLWVPTCFNVALDIQKTPRAVHECRRCNAAPHGTKCQTCNKTINHITLKKCGPCGKCDACEMGEPCPDQTTCDFCTGCGKCKKCRYCPECHRFELLEWTQGTNFNFVAGDTLYDTPAAREGVWSESLKTFRYCIEVIEASPAVPAKLPPRDPTKPDLSYPRNPGAVAFKLFVPNSDRSALLLEKKYKLSQDDFLKFLITGRSEAVTLAKEGMLF